MEFTVKISDTSPKAKSIINMLKELAEDYSFIHISDDEDIINENILKEFDARKAYIKQHPDEWKTWDEVKNKLLEQ